MEFVVRVAQQQMKLCRQGISGLWREEDRKNNDVYHYNRLVNWATLDVEMIFS